MTRRDNLRVTVVAAAAVAALCGGLTMPSASAARSQRVVLRDISSDANGINDGSEGFAQGVPTPHSVAEADIRTVDVSPLRNRAGRTIGYRLTLTTTGRPDKIRATGTPLSYQVIMRVTSDCRVGVSHVAHRGARLDWSCDDEVFGRSAGLVSRVRNDHLVIKVPYRLGPDEMRPGQVIEQTEAYTHTAPLARHTGHPVLTTILDSTQTYDQWALPR